jgi:hypothetical protein
MAGGQRLLRPCESRGSIYRQQQQGEDGGGAVCRESRDGGASVASARTVAACTAHKWHAAQCPAGVGRARAPHRSSSSWKRKLWEPPRIQLRQRGHVVPLHALVRAEGPDYRRWRNSTLLPAAAGRG